MLVSTLCHVHREAALPTTCPRSSSAYTFPPTWVESDSSTHGQHGLAVPHASAAAAATSNAASSLFPLKNLKTEIVSKENKRYDGSRTNFHIWVSTLEPTPPSVAL